MCVGWVGRGRWEAERQRMELPETPEVRGQKSSRTSFWACSHAGHARKVSVRLRGIKDGAFRLPDNKGQEIVIWPPGHMTGSRSPANCMSDPVEGNLGGHDQVKGQ